MMLHTQEEAAKLQKKASSLSIEANVGIIGLGSASTEYSQTSESEESRKQSKSSKYEEVWFEGGEPNPVTGIIPQSNTPAFLGGEIASVCSLPSKWFPTKVCMDFASSKAYCFSNLPDFPEISDGYQAMVENLFQIKSVPQCYEIGVPLFGKTLIRSQAEERYPGSKDLFIQTKARNQRECVFDCVRNKDCAVSSWRNTMCLLCLSEQRTNLTDLQVFKINDNDNERSTEQCLHSTMHDNNMGIEFEVLTVDGEKFCALKTERYDDSSHCSAAIGPCKPGDSCFVHQHQRSSAPLFRAHMKKPNAFDYGLPLHSQDRIEGNPIEILHFGVNLNHDKARLLCSYIRKTQFVKDKKEITDKGRDLAGLLYFVTGDQAKPFCERLDGCDAMAVSIDLDTLTEVSCPMAFENEDPELTGKPEVDSFLKAQDWLEAQMQAKGKLFNIFPEITIPEASPAEYVDVCIDQSHVWRGCILFSHKKDCNRKKHRIRCFMCNATDCEEHLMIGSDSRETFRVYRRLWRENRRVFPPLRREFGSIELNWFKNRSFEIPEDNMWKIRWDKDEWKRQPKFQVFVAKYGDRKFRSWSFSAKIGEDPFRNGGAFFRYPDKILDPMASITSSQLLYALNNSAVPVRLRVELRSMEESMIVSDNDISTKNVNSEAQLGLLIDSNSYKNPREDPNLPKTRYDASRTGFLRKHELHGVDHPFDKINDKPTLWIKGGKDITWVRHGPLNPPERAWFPPKEFVRDTGSLPTQDAGSPSKEDVKSAGSSSKEDVKKAGSPSKEDVKKIKKSIATMKDRARKIFVLGWVTWELEIQDDFRRTDRGSKAARQHQQGIRMDLKKISSEFQFWSWMQLLWSARNLSKGWTCCQLSTSQQVNFFKIWSKSLINLQVVNDECSEFAGNKFQLFLNPLIK